MTDPEEPINQPPILSGPSVEYIVGGFGRDIAFEGLDQDGAAEQVLTFCKLRGPDWATVSGQGTGTGPLSGTLALYPTDQEPGVHEILLGLAEGDSCSSSVIGQHAITVHVGRVWHFYKDFCYPEVDF